MTAPASTDPTGPPAACPTAGAERGLVEASRRLAGRCRAACRLDPHCACVRLAGGRAPAAVWAEALLRILREGLGRPPRFYAPGSAELSFDERWLAALVAAHRRRDMASARFLIARRIRPEARGAVRFLAAGLARGLDDTGADLSFGGAPFGAAGSRIARSRRTSR
jgi:hypothetical protein